MKNPQTKRNARCEERQQPNIEPITNAPNLVRQTETFCFKINTNRTTQQSYTLQRPSIENPNSPSQIQRQPLSIKDFIGIQQHEPVYSGDALAHTKKNVDEMLDDEYSEKHDCPWTQSQTLNELTTLIV
jgi:hypothetical protein